MLLSNVTDIAITPTSRCFSKSGFDLVDPMFRISTCTSCLKHACTPGTVSWVWSGWWSLFRPKLLISLPWPPAFPRQCAAVMHSSTDRLRPCLWSQALQSQGQQRRMHITQVLQEELLHFCQLHRDLVCLRQSFGSSHLNCLKETTGVC